MEYFTPVGLVNILGLLILLGFCICPGVEDCSYIFSLVEYSTLILGGSLSLGEYH